MPWFRFIVLGAFLSGLGPAIVAQQAVPDLTGRVVDRADLLSEHAETALTTLLEEHEAQTGNQVVVLTMASLDGEPIESFAVRVATQWALGTTEQDNGVLLVVAVQDRLLRIEVGAGLEGALTDALAGRIIRNDIVPRFREEDYEAGVLAGVDAMLSALNDTYVLPDADTPVGSAVENTIVTVITWIIWLGFVAFTAFLLLSILFALPVFVRWPFFVISIPGYWWLGSILGDSVVGRILGGVFAAGLYVLMFAGFSSSPGLLEKGDGKSSGTKRRTGRRRTGRNRSSGRRFGGGGSSFGGSFSGGGGSFSGGGASGSW